MAVRRGRCGTAAQNFKSSKTLFKLRRGRGSVPRLIKFRRAIALAARKHFEILGFETLDVVSYVARRGNLCGPVDFYNVIFMCRTPSEVK